MNTNKSILLFWSTRYNHSYLPKEIIDYISRLYYHITIEKTISDLLAKNEYVIVPFDIHIKDPNRSKKSYFVYDSDGEEVEFYDSTSSDEEVIGFDVLDGFRHSDSSIVERRYLLWISNTYDMSKELIPSYIVNRRKEHTKWMNFIRNSEWIEICYKNEKLHVERSIIVNLRQDQYRVFKSKIDKGLRSKYARMLGRLFNCWSTCMQRFSTLVLNFLTNYGERALIVMFILSLIGLIIDYIFNIPIVNHVCWIVIIIVVFYVRVFYIDAPHVILPFFM